MAVVTQLRASHYLCYQRVEQDPEGDTVASSGGGGGNAPSSSLGGGGAAGSRLEVKFNYVVYEGEMQDGMRDGRGICLYNNNNLYEGEYKKNREHGIGTLMTSDWKRIIYEGAWEKGRMHGHGAYYYYSGGIRRRKRRGSGGGGGSVSGKRSSPQFCQSLRNGRGVYTLPNGSFYDGEFCDNIQNGYGIFHWPIPPKFVQWTGRVHIAQR